MNSAQRTPTIFVSAEVGVYPLLPLIDSYLGFYASHSSHTARAKRGDLALFVQFLVSNFGPTPMLDHLTYSTVQRFVASREAIEAPRTVSRRLATLKHFCARLSDVVPGFVNITREIKGPSVVQLQFKALSHEQARALYVAAAAKSVTGFKGFRDAAIALILLETGLRHDEARLLNVEQLSGDWFLDVKCKGKKVRPVPLAASLREFLDRYVSERHIFCGSPTGPMFFSTLSRKLRPLNEKSFWRIVRELGKQAGIPDLHPHMLRHTYGYALSDALKDPRMTAQLMGHSDLNISMLYTNRPNDRVLAAANSAMEHFKGLLK